MRIDYINLVKIMKEIYTLKDISEIHISNKKNVDILKKLLSDKISRKKNFILILNMINLICELDKGKNINEIKNIDDIPVSIVCLLQNKDNRDKNFIKLLNLFNLSNEIDNGEKNLKEENKKFIDEINKRFIKI